MSAFVRVVGLQAKRMPVIERSGLTEGTPRTKVAASMSVRYSRNVEQKATASWRAHSAGCRMERRAHSPAGLAAAASEDLRRTHLDC